MKPPALDPERASASIDAALGWIVKAADEGYGASTLTDQAYLTVLAGLSIGNAAGCAMVSGQMLLWAQRTAELLDADRGTETFDPYAHDPRLMLICASRMKRCGVDSATMLRFVDEVDSALSGPTGSTALVFGAELALLTEMGTTQSFVMRSMDLADLPVGPLELLHRDDLRRQLVDVVAGATWLGGRAAPAPVRSALCDVVEVLALQAFKDYDLIAGCELLRTLRYLGANDGLATAFAIDYLLSQQRDDGCFGYLADELARSEASSGDLSVYLPVTVSAIWAVAEAAIPGFRLVPAPPPDCG